MVCGSWLTWAARDGASELTSASLRSNLNRAAQNCSSRWYVRAAGIAASLLSAVAAVLVSAPSAYADDGLSLAGTVTKNCGVATCSYYLTRHDTKLLADFLAKRDWQANLAQVPVCAAVGAVTSAIGGVYCEGTWIWVTEEVQRAANDHGDRGACLKLTYIPSNPPLPTYWSTNNGQYCHD